MVDRTPNYNLELIDFNKIPWHEREHDNWRTIDAVFSNFIIVSDMQGVWQNATAVTVGQRYVDAELGTIWEVLIAHTTPSTGTFAESRTAIPANWETFTVSVTNQGAWAIDTAYSPNDFLTDTARYGVVVAQHTSETDYDTGVSDGNIVTLIDLTAFILPTLATDVMVIGNSAGTAWEALAGAALRSIVGLTTNANKMIYTTALDTYAVTALTAFARTILDDANAGAVRTTISAVGEVSTQVFTSDDTYTKPSDLLYAIVEVTGAGGGGGGADSDGSFRGTGGGGGGYAMEVLVASAIGSTEIVTVGVGAAGGNSQASPTAGSVGETSSFGTLLTATGGEGGLAGVTGAQSGVVGGVGTGGDVNSRGKQSHSKYATNGNTEFGGRGGDGGGPYGGSGGLLVGAAGTQYGSGGAAGNHTGPTNGGAGFGGIVVVTEFKT